MPSSAKSGGIRMSTTATSGCLASTSRSSPSDIAGFPDHVEPGVPEHGADALADEDAVVGYDDAHGSSARTFVPSPGLLATENEPPTAATRSASPVRPVPSRRRGPAVAVVGDLEDEVIAVVRLR